MSGEGGVIVIGAIADDDKGAAYVFVKPAGGWGTSPLTETAKLTTSDEAVNAFGSSVAVSADSGVVVVGAPYGSAPGAVYVFAKPSAGGWASSSTAAKLTPGEGMAGDAFGFDVDISADSGVIVVGAPYRRDEDAAYIFTKPDAGWASTSAAVKIAPHDGERLDNFGVSVSISADGGMIIAGSSLDNFYDSRVGSAYAFAKPEGGWSSAAVGVKIIAPGLDSPSSRFGGAVSLGGDIIAVGASGEDWYSGRAYVFAASDPPAAPTLSVSAPSAAVGEGESAEFTVALSAASAKTVSVEYRMSAGWRQRHFRRGLRKRQRDADIRAGRNFQEGADRSQSRRRGRSGGRDVHAASPSRRQRGDSRRRRERGRRDSQPPSAVQPAARERRRLRLRRRFIGRRRWRRRRRVSARARPRDRLLAIRAVVHRQERRRGYGAHAPNRSLERRARRHELRSVIERELAVVLAAPRAVHRA